eukprot:TRINITY_DN7064_c0_g1_i3.p1 TRINITY_DN7064_c0_g1~~TRINITY_DN7064_c0_g1_i3.p1  ORF type:complete len:502 (-),score=169.36 TRINITY_DN7064_c0_g1_i3:43-1548(-)
MGVRECCAKSNEYEEDRTRQSEAAQENRRRGKSNYEDWQPSWQNDEVDGEDDYEVNRKTPVTEVHDEVSKKDEDEELDGKVPDVGDGYVKELPKEKPPPSKLNRREELKRREEELKRKQEELRKEQEALMKEEEATTSPKPKAQSKEPMESKEQAKAAISPKEEEELKWKREVERRRQRLQAVKSEPIEEIKEEIKKEEPKRENIKKQEPKPQEQPVKEKVALAPAIKKDKTPEKKAPPKKVTFKLPKSSYLTSVVNRDFSDVQANLKKQLIKAKFDSKTQSGNDAIPFLIAGSLYMDNYALIFSRDFHGLDAFENIKGFDAIAESYKLKTLTITSKSKTLIRKEVEAFLREEGANSYFAGCINDRKNAAMIHFLFIQTSAKMPKCECIPTEATHSETIISELTKQLEVGKEFRANLTVFNDSFSSAIARFFICQQTETRRERSEYNLMEFTDYDFLNADILQKEKKGNELMGVIVGVSFEDSFLVFISNNCLPNSLCIVP